MIPIIVSFSFRHGEKGGREMQAGREAWRKAGGEVANKASKQQGTEERERLWRRIIPTYCVFVPYICSFFFPFLFSFLLSSYRFFPSPIHPSLASSSSSSGLLTMNGRIR